MSYLLSGHWPYVSIGEHVNLLLNKKLQTLDLAVSLLRQDLRFLSEGLEGRSDNPIAKLFDELLQPGADLGLGFPSLVDWIYDPCHQSVSHLVIGNKMPGGSWNGLPGHIETLSPVSWLQLPGYSFEEWQRSWEIQESDSQDESAFRIKTENVRQYYVDYVSQTGIAENVMNRTAVVSLRRLEKSELQKGCTAFSQNGTAIDECQPTMHSAVPGCFCWNETWHRLATPPPVTDSLSIPGDYRFELTMRSDLDDDVDRLSPQQEVRIRAKCVVLAVGLGHPRHLNIPGERLQFVSHKYPDDTRLLADAQSSGDPIMVVGSGLCAADVILMSFGLGCKVTHVFRRKATDGQLIFNKLPPGGYPEYDRVRCLMHGSVTDEQYSCLECHSLKHIDQDKVCTLVNISGDELQLKVSHVFILIGSNSDLSFLPADLQRMGIQPGKPVSKANPVDIDPITFEVRQQPGLYAIGPIVGDNFVRFGIGGALGVASHLVKGSQADTRRNSCIV